MPRRRDVLPEELTSIIKLRQSKTSWLQIEHATSVPRQIAKRAYEAWEHSQSREKLKQARIQVATNLFNEHLERIVQLAEALVDRLPQSMMFYETRDAETTLNNDVWTRDILEETEELISVVSLQQKTEKQQRRILHQNQILFRSLRDHTREKVHWQVLEGWKGGWNTCRSALEELRSKAKETVWSILNNQKLKVRNKIEGSPSKENIVKNMVDGVVEVLWRGIQDDSLGRVSALVRVTPTNKGTALIVFGELASVTSIELADHDLAENIASICRWVAENLYILEKQGQIKRYETGIESMKKAVKELEESLNPLMLRPMVLNTECDLCPA